MSLTILVSIDISAVVDLDLTADRTGAVDGLERSLVVFWGVVDQRMETGFIERLANDMTAGTILLVGPQDNPDPALLKLSRVVCLPPLPHAQLPALAAAASVLVMPYRDMPVTRAMQPLKLKEYLATGKPTVVRRLPAVTEWNDALDAVDTAEQFSAAVRARLVEGTTAAQRRSRERLTTEGWDTKARQFECLLYASGVETSVARSRTSCPVAAASERPA